MRPTVSRPPRSAGAQSSFAKLKRHDKILLLLGVALMLIAGFLFQGYRQAQESKEKASKQLSNTERSLNALKKDFDVAALEKKQADINKWLSGPDNPWYKSYESLDVDNLVTASAVQNKVEVVRLSLGKDSKNKINSIEYQVELRQVEVKGELANIVRFLDQIERGPFRALRLNRIKIGLAKGTWNGTFDIELWYLGAQGDGDAGRKG